MEREMGEKNCIEGNRRKKLEREIGEKNWRGR